MFWVEVEEEEDLFGALWLRFFTLLIEFNLQDKFRILLFFGSRLLLLLNILKISKEVFEFSDNSVIISSFSGLTGFIDDGEIVLKASPLEVRENPAVVGVVMFCALLSPFEELIFSWNGFSGSIVSSLDVYDEGGVMCCIMCEWNLMYCASGGD